MLKAAIPLRGAFIKIMEIIDGFFWIALMLGVNRALFWQVTSNEYIDCSSWFNKLRGLYFRPSNNVCVIYPCKCIHTFFFFRKIDVAFLNRDRYVIRAIRNLRPWKIKFCKESYFVIERFAYPEKNFFKIGDQVN